ncbi:Cdc6-like AAA superfamily ATPase [Methanococcus voltae]|uniref:Cdc6-like AAA superfamily ATPase n=1 Tax=Methanococcus voltae TaxID=2188 RepID=A0A8J7S613_METVO|nr:ATP-binding protein [Methanococcus voltae]MBP2202170.1 Cdc6-like AAA superfamily ATPase [Methanococcus voltae]
MNIYLGQGSSNTRVRVGDRTKRFLNIKGNEANHIELLGASGFGKTTCLRGLAEEAFIKCKQNRETALIIVFERKYDVNKIKTYYEIFNYEKVNNTSQGRIYKKYGNANWEYVKKYLSLASKDKKGQLGKIGDFAFSYPNLFGMYAKHNPRQKGGKGNSLLGQQGLKPTVFPTRRIVFRPTRSLEHIKIDNGFYSCTVKEANIAYKHLPFNHIAALAAVNEGTLNGSRLKNLWNIQDNLCRNPEKILIEALSMENNSGKPSQTYYRIEEAMNRLIYDKLFQEQDNLFKNLTTDAINVIDFSQNSNLESKEENLIFRLIVEFAINVATKKNVKVFFILDEVQNFLQDSNGKWATDKILREGRSACINLISGTQYMNSLPKSLVMGSTHIGVVGRLGSMEDKNMLQKMIPDFNSKIEVAEPDSYGEYFESKRQLKGKGYFSFDKMFTERIEYRQPQSI